jgi:hypothetical protein
MPAGLLGTVRGWFSQHANAYVLASIPPDGEDDEAAPLQPYASYLRVWISDMFLAKRVSWLRSWFPTVHAEVTLPVAGQPAVTFARVARPADSSLGEGVLLNYAVTDLVPFNGGTVEVQAALLGLEGDDRLAAGVKLLQTFSGLVGPPLGQALTIAEKVTPAARDFLEQADGDVTLALHQTFTSGGGGGDNVLRPCYLAVVLAAQEEVNPKRLRVKGDRLHLIKDGGRLEPFTSHDHMLLRIEGRPERDDWQRLLPEVMTARNRAVDALARGDHEAAQQQLGVALTAVLTSTDLADGDKRRVVKAVKDQWADLAEVGLGVAPSELPGDMPELLDRYPMSREAAAAGGRLTAEEVFG